MNLHEIGLCLNFRIILKKLEIIEKIIHPGIHRVLDNKVKALYQETEDAND